MPQSDPNKQPTWDECRAVLQERITEISWANYDLNAPWGFTPPKLKNSKNGALPTSTCPVTGEERSPGVSKSSPKKRGLSTDDVDSPHKRTRTQAGSPAPGAEINRVHDQSNRSPDESLALRSPVVHPPTVTIFGDGNRAASTVTWNGQTYVSETSMLDLSTMIEFSKSTPWPEGYKPQRFN